MALIERSYLPQDMKESYQQLVAKRASMLA